MGLLVFIKKFSIRNQRISGAVLSTTFSKMVLMTSGLERLILLHWLALDSHVLSV